MNAKSDSLFEVEITERVAETPEIARFVLRDPAGGALPPFTAGAHVDVSVAGTLRQYSLCNDPAGRDLYEIAVLREPASRGGSEAIHAGFQAGGRIRIGLPRNHFALRPGAGPVLLFGGGIGVTPMLAMAAELHAAGRAFSLHYCARSAAGMAFRERLAQAPYATRVALHLDDGAAAQRLDPAAVLTAAGPQAQVYVCGPGGFIDWICTAAREAGLPAGQIHREIFAAPETAAPDAGTVGGFEVEIASTGAVYAIGAEDSILDVLEAQGIEILRSCQQGICGSCVTRVLAGTPIHNDYVLTDEDRDEQGLFTPCCSRAAPGDRLVLDL